MIRFVLLGIVILISRFATGQNLNQVGEGSAVDLSGSLSFRTGYYNTSLSYNRQEPNAYSLSGSAVLSLYDWRIPFTISYANEQFNSNNPFQHFGISPQYKWIKMHLGYSSMSFSPYTLNNHTFLGGGIELTPGKFRFSAMYGRLREKQTIIKDKYLSFKPPAYKRMGYGFKLGYGTSANYIDLILFKADDDPSSLPVTDSLSVLPSENLVIGVSSRVQIFKNLSWEVHVAGSAFSRNVHTKKITAGEIELPSMLTSLFQPRLSSRVNYAGHTSLNLQFRHFGLRGRYKRVQPGYKSLGMYYINNDVEQYTIAPSFRLFKGLLSLSASLGLERDNLLNNKAARTNRFISSANLNWSTKGPFGLSMQYSNYQLDQSPALLELNDTTKVAMVNSNLSLIPRLVFQSDRSTNQFTLFLSSQALNDNNDFTAAQTETSTYTGNFNYVFRNNKKHYNLKAGINLTQVSTPINEILRYGFRIGGGKAFFEETLRTNLRLDYRRQQLDKTDAGYVLGFYFDSSYRLESGHALTFMLKLTKNETANMSFSENMASLRYSYNF